MQSGARATADQPLENQVSDGAQAPSNSSASDLNRTFLDLNFPNQETSAERLDKSFDSTTDNQPLFPELPQAKIGVELGKVIKVSELAPRWDIEKFQSFVIDRIRTIFKSAEFDPNWKINFRAVKEPESTWRYIRDLFFPSKAATLSLDIGEETVDLIQVRVEKTFRGFGVSLHPIENGSERFPNLVVHLAQNLTLDLNRGSTNVEGQPGKRSISGPLLHSISDQMNAKLSKLIEREHAHKAAQETKALSFSQYLIEFQSSELGKSFSKLLEARASEITFPKPVAATSYLLSPGDRFEQEVVGKYRLSFDGRGFQLSAQEKICFTSIGFIWDNHQSVEFRLNGRGKDWVTSAEIPKGLIKEILKQCPSSEDVEKWLVGELKKLG